MKIHPILPAFVVGVLVGALSVGEVLPPSAAQLAGMGLPAGGSSPGAVALDTGGDAGQGGPGTGPAGGNGASGNDAANGGSGAGNATGPTAGRMVGGTDAVPGATDGGTGGDGDGSDGGEGPSVGGPDGSSVACAPGKNGGATDQGVTADKIVLATTVVESGIGSAFLGEVRYAMEAVKNRVNREGGICGRQLEITYRDDGWNAQLGAQFLRNFIQEGIFAVPVGPSSEGLNTVITSGDFDKAQVPVVGTDGLIIKQYQQTSGAAQPWVWPVAAATVSSARVMAIDAFNRMRKDGLKPKASDFSVVFDSNYKFGQEGSEAFNAQVRKLTGSDIPGYKANATSCDRGFCGVTAGQSSYSGQVQQFVEGKFVALFLEPDTALKWMNDSNAPRADAIPYGVGAAQPLFTRGFAETCKTKCDQMVAWSGFKPFVEQYRSDAAVQRYVNDLRAACPSCDEANQFSQGAYVGMELLVAGLRKAGPNLTRMGLKSALDSMNYPCGLCLQKSLAFTPNNRYASTTMQGWQIQYKGTFGGWRAGNVVRDPAF
jgi:ABC-type branched-subunit amino acid transport system substrate-binding protein